MKEQNIYSMFEKNNEKKDSKIVSDVSIFEKFTFYIIDFIISVVKSCSEDNYSKAVDDAYKRSEKMYEKNRLKSWKTKLEYETNYNALTKRYETRRITRHVYE